jgi:hypothetical protein
MTSVQPRIQIDAKNHLQLLFVVQPRLFCHTIIKPDGSIGKREYYRDLRQSSHACYDRHWCRSCWW